MGIHTPTLAGLANELLSTSEQQQMRTLLQTQPLDYQGLLAFDQSMGGPSLGRVTCAGHGRYEIPDRAVFRPLQYIERYFEKLDEGSTIDWLARTIVYDSSLHIESLVKKIGQLGPLPLGTALGESIIRRKLDTITWKRIKRFTSPYNASKHDYNQPKDSHLFSVTDAILAYVVARKLGAALYPIAGLATNLTIFDQACN